MDNLHVREIFDLGEKNKTAGKNSLKVDKIAKISLRNAVKCGKYSFAKFASFVYFCIACGNCYHF